MDYNSLEEIKKEMMRIIKEEKFKGTIYDWADKLDISDDQFLLVESAINDLEDEGKMGLVGYKVAFYNNHP